MPSHRKAAKIHNYVGTSASHNSSVVLGESCAPVRLVGQSDAIQALRCSVARVAASLPIRAVVAGEYGVGKLGVAAAIYSDSGGVGEVQHIECRRSGALDTALGVLAAGSSQGMTVPESSRYGAMLLDAPEALSLDEQHTLVAALQQFDDGASVDHYPPMSLIGVLREPVAALLEGLELSQLLLETFDSFVSIPPLRFRGDDAVELAERQVHRLNQKHDRRCSFTKELLELYRAYDWPGNVRQLRKVTADVFQTSKHDQLRPDSSSCAELLAQHHVSVTALFGRRICDVQQDLLSATLRHHGGSKSLTAETLGISLKTLYNRLRDVGAN